VAVPDSPECTPRFGVNTNWSGNTCAKLYASVAQARPVELAASPAPEPPSHCTLNLGINRNWLDGHCAKLYGDSPTLAGPTQAAPVAPSTAPPSTTPPSTTSPSTTPPPNTSRCEPNLGFNRDWLDSNCAKLHDDVAQPGQTKGVSGMDRLGEMLSSVVHPADWLPYRSLITDVSYGIGVAAVLIVIAVLAARFLWWAFEGRFRGIPRQQRDRVSLLTTDPFASVRTRNDIIDPRARQARDVADRANELQASLFGQPS
jgi:hypothetical protein